MSISQALLPEFEQEMDGTRRTLERVPDDRMDWKPHEKSMPLGDLAAHLANVPSWAVHVVREEAIDIAAPDGSPLRIPRSRSRAETLAAFDKNVAAAREAISEATDEHLFKQWTLLHGGRTVFMRPRAEVLRVSVMNHLIHHRAQLGVYLRLCDIPVPSIYGPSADEGGF
jgi:uncharacterized damage-inducible protein DinB